MSALTVIDLGRAAYTPTFELQQRLVRDVQDSAEERAYLVLVEHDPPVITLGRGADRANVLASAERLAAEGIELIETTRGGDVTYHGPGQLVGYPILDLARHGRDVHAYLRTLEQVLIDTIARLGVVGHREPGMTGVWVGEAKVAALGVTVSRWVTYHGFALNVCPNLAHFDLIIPCGLREKPVTSLAQLLGRSVTIAEIKPLLVEIFRATFGFPPAR